MKKQFFSAFGTETITVEFDCKYCKHQIITDPLSVPSQERLEALEEGGDIYIKNDESIYCDNCEKQYNLEIWVTEGEAHVTILELKDSGFIHILEKGTPPDFYPFLTEDELEHFLAIESNQKFFETFLSEIENLKELLNTNLNNPLLVQTFLKQIYIAAVTAMETFLSDTFVILTLESESNLRRFVKFFPDYQKANFSLSDIFEKYESIKDIAKSSMLDIIFHNLAKVRMMYSRTFNIEFPPIDDPAKCIAIRHDLVHRNGKSKTGTHLLLKVDDVSLAIETIESFVKEVAERLYHQGGRTDNRLSLMHNIDYRSADVPDPTSTDNNFPHWFYDVDNYDDLPF